MRAKRAEQEAARRLRAEGASLRTIAQALGVSVASVSVWTRPAPSSAAHLEAAGATQLVGRRLPVADLGTRRRCGRCGLVLPAALFGRGQYRCRRCSREYLKARGDLHRAQSGAALVRRRQRAQAYLLAYLVAHPCLDCGESDPVVLEFDHVRGKRMGLAQLAHLGARTARLDEELALCEVVCACCHRRRTVQRRGPAAVIRKSRARNARYVDDLLRRSACADCGQTDRAVLDFDHVGFKTANIAELVNREAPLERIQHEVTQCIVRCANCHRRRTSEAGGHFRSQQA
jgi:transposase-like protein